MSNLKEVVVTINDIEFQAEIDYDQELIVEANISGAPEDCNEASGGEITINHIHLIIDTFPDSLPYMVDITLLIPLLHDSILDNWDD